MARYREKPIELKPCPFCGGEAKLCFTEPPEAWVTCPACGIHLGLKPSKNQAIEAWNARHERTCRNVSRDSGWLMCSVCGAFTKVTDATDEIPARRCGSCGAKVVES